MLLSYGMVPGLKTGWYISLFSPSLHYQATTWTNKTMELTLENLKDPVMLACGATTINGVKTRVTKLGKVASEIIAAIFEKDLGLPVPHGTDIVCRTLKCVWDWPEGTKLTFWKIFLGLVLKLSSFWSFHGLPGKEVILNDLRTWNVITWYEITPHLPN